MGGAFSEISIMVRHCGIANLNKFGKIEVEKVLVSFDAKSRRIGESSRSQAIDTVNHPLVALIL